MIAAKTNAYITITVSVALCSLGIALYRGSVAACKRRGVALAIRKEALKREAHDKLKIGTKKADVVRFFVQNGIPLTLEQDRAHGHIYVRGCFPSGCSQYLDLVVDVQLDAAGNVKSEPMAGGFYYGDCM